MSRSVLASRSSSNTGLQNGRSEYHLGCCAINCCLIRFQTSTSFSPGYSQRNCLHLSTSQFSFLGGAKGKFSRFFSLVSILRAHSLDGRWTGTSIAAASSPFPVLKASSKAWPASPTNMLAPLVSSWFQGFNRALDVLGTPIVLPADCTGDDEASTLHDCAELSSPVALSAPDSRSLGCNEDVMLLGCWVLIDADSRREIRLVEWFKICKSPKESHGSIFPVMPTRTSVSNIEVPKVSA